MKVLLDMNTPSFQKTLLELGINELLAFQSTLRKIKQMTWEQLYKDKGIRWEKIANKNSKNIGVYSFRFSQKYRGTAYRDGDYLVLIDLFVDHDGAYE